MTASAPSAPPGPALFGRGLIRGNGALADRFSFFASGFG